MAQVCLLTGTGDGIDFTGQPAASGGWGLLQSGCGLFSKVYVLQAWSAWLCWETVGEVGEVGGPWVTEGAALEQLYASCPRVPRSV